MGPTPERLILASASASRARLLLAAGIVAGIEASEIDEAPIKSQVRASGGSGLDCALLLAEEKARAVAARHRDALVVGADQILVLGDRWFDKPDSLAAAREQLCALRGRSHTLATAACVVRDGDLLWQGTSEPVMTMRRFGDAFLDAYLPAEGAAALGSVGGYRLEGRGVQLFSRIDGDYFAILGLPLVPLLNFLRERGTIAS
jgi:septum formation protein